MVRPRLYSCISIFLILPSLVYAMEAVISMCRISMYIENRIQNNPNVMQLLRNDTIKTYWFSISLLKTALNGCPLMYLPYLVLLHVQLFICCQGQYNPLNKICLSVVESKRQIVTSVETSIYEYTI